jgi:hypothetical protein
VESPYTPVEIEAKWQKAWAEENLDATPDDRSQLKFYALLTTIDSFQLNRRYFRVSDPSVNNQMLRPLL